MITPRTTSLVRAANLRLFRRALVRLARQGAPLDARDRLVVVPTTAARLLLTRTIERSAPGATVVLPEIVTRADLHDRLFARLAAVDVPPVYRGVEREAMLALACHEAIRAGVEPPFRVRPALVGAMLDFYDALRRQQKSVDDFERLAVAYLEGDADSDRGAARLLLQTRFLVAAFRDFERRAVEAGGLDEHAVRQRLLAQPAAYPWRHVVLAVRDRGTDPYGLFPCDWDLLSRIPGLEQLDVVATDMTVAGTFHERIHGLLPGIEEEREGDGEVLEEPTLLVSPEGETVQTARDREDEVGGFVRWVRQLASERPDLRLDGVGLVVQQRLPYVYLAREVCRSAGVPLQMVDALPLAAEPYAAAVDQVLACVGANMARAQAVELLRSPHLAFMDDEGARLSDADVSALDRALAEAGYLGDVEALARLVDAWSAADAPSAPSRAAVRAARVLRGVALELVPLMASAAVAVQVERLRQFLAAHQAVPADDVLRARQLRARGAVHGLLASIGEAHTRFPGVQVDGDELAALLRRAIEAHTFAPRTGSEGVHLVDAESARFGDFTHVQLAGLVDGEWPGSARRDIFYSAGLLRDLGWPAERERVDAVRASFVDLLRLPSSRLVVSAFSLEQDALVSPSVLVEDVEHAGLPAIEHVRPARRIFEYEALGTDPWRVDVGSDEMQRWSAVRQARHAGPLPSPGRVRARAAGVYSVSALERYQDCPFKFFAQDVLRLEEPVVDEAHMSPRSRGRFIHEVFQRFFEAWQARYGGTIDTSRLAEARHLFEEVSGPLLARLSPADARLERLRLFGSAIAMGIVDVVLALEAERRVDVRERMLEHRFEGAYTLGATDGWSMTINGVADRIDLLDGRRLRVIDYKSGSAPDPKRALQVSVYALCAQEHLATARGEQWEVDEAAYVAFTGKRPLLRVNAICIHW